MEALEFRPEFEIQGLEYKEIVGESPFHSVSSSNLHVPLLCVSVSLRSRVTGFKTIVLSVISPLCLQFHRHNQIQKSMSGQSIFWSDNRKRFPQGAKLIS